MYFYLLQNKKRMRKNNNLRVTNTSWPLLDLAVVGVLHQQLSIINAYNDQ
jgi:hypothetical protein